MCSTAAEESQPKMEIKCYRISVRNGVKNSKGSQMLFEMATKTSDKQLVLFFLFRFSFFFPNKYRMIKSKHALIFSNISVVCFDLK